MTFIFQPAIYRDETLWKLPRPVTSCRVREAWDFEKFKVPLAVGDVQLGHSREGVDLLLEGQIGSQADELKLSEETMFAAIESLRSQLDVTSEATKFEFFLYHDDATDTYRKFQSCSTVRLEYDLSNPHLFTYSAVIHADNPTIFDTAPGE